MSKEHEAALARAHAHALAFRQSLATRPNRPRLDYDQFLAQNRTPLPESETPAPEVIETLASMAEPGLMAMPGPRFFAWVLGGSHPAGVAADWLVSAWGQNAGYHTPTPAVSALEAIAADWLLDILDLPRACSVGFATGATVANAVCLSAARGAQLRKHGWDADADGLFGAPPIRVLLGADAHTSVLSALQFIGLGHDRVERVASDAQGRMRADALADALAGLDGPAIVIAQAGQINTGAFDPFAEITQIAAAAGAWVHVDGAFGLWARAAPDRAPLTTGIEHADSWATDGHKWLQTPFDTGYAIVRDRDAHARAMTTRASYLPAIGAGERVPSALVPELSRRARGVPTWAMLKTLGRTGVARMVSRHAAIARAIAAGLAAEPGVRVLNDVVLNQVIIAFGEGAAGEGEGGDALTRAVIEAVQAEDTCYVGGADWRGRWVMRISVINYATTEEDGARAAESIVRAWRAVRAAAAS